MPSTTLRMALPAALHCARGLRQILPTATASRPAWLGRLGIDTHGLSQTLAAEKVVAAETMFISETRYPYDHTGDASHAPADIPMLIQETLRTTAVPISSEVGRSRSGRRSLDRPLQTIKNQLNQSACCTEDYGELQIFYYKYYWFYLAYFHRDPAELGMKDAKGGSDASSVTAEAGVSS